MSSPKASTSGADDVQSGDEGDEAGSYSFLRGYRVFNCDQIDGLDEKYHPALPDEDAPTTKAIPELQSWFEAIGGDVRFGGDRAFYKPSNDFIQMPEIGRFF